MKTNKRLTNHLNKAYEHNEKARAIILHELQRENDDNTISLLVQYKLQTLDVKFKLKELLEKADELL